MRAIEREGLQGAGPGQVDLRLLGGDVGQLLVQ
jgi:hypothetical protein